MSTILFAAFSAEGIGRHQYNSLSGLAMMSCIIFWMPQSFRTQDNPDAALKSNQIAALNPTQVMALSFQQARSKRLSANRSLLYQSTA